MNILEIQRLLNDQRSPLNLCRPANQPGTALSGSVFYVLKCIDSSKKGKGVDTHKQFNYFQRKVSTTSESPQGKRDSFIIRLDISLDEQNELSPKINIKVGGDFQEIMQFVFNQIPTKMKVKVYIEFGLQNSDHIFHHFVMDGQKVEGVDLVFQTNPAITPKFARQLTRDFGTRGHKNVVDVTIDLIGSDILSSASGAGVPRDLGRAILNELEASEKDFTLVSKDGTRFGCHKLMLRVTKSKFFLTHLDGDWKNSADPECNFFCSDKSVQIFRDFLYGGSLSEMENDVGVALELLEHAEIMDYQDLGSAIKDLILRKDDQWLSLKDALLLFRKTLDWTLLKGLEDLQKKAVKAIILTHEGLLSSNSHYEQLFGNNADATQKLLFACIAESSPQTRRLASSVASPDRAEVLNGVEDQTLSNEDEVDDAESNEGEETELSPVSADGSEVEDEDE